MSKLKTENDVTLLKSKITQGFSILILREFFIKIFSFGGQLIIARILIPSDFGYFVIISFIVGFFGLFSDIGLTWALIQKEKQPTKKEVATTLSIKIIINALLILCIILVSPFIKYFYSTFDVIHVQMLQIFSITLLLTSIRSVPIALLEREIQYHIISFIDIIGVIAYQIAVLIFAVLQFGAWSLICAVIIKEAIEVSFALYKKPIFPIFTVKFSHIKKLIHFGIFIQGNGFINFFHTSIVPAIVGIRNGPYEVGILDWSSSIAAIPMSITDNFGRVAFSGWSRFQSDTKFLSLAVQKSIGILSIISLLFTVLILGFSREAVTLLYTDKWLAGIPALYWFCGNTFFISVMSAIGSAILVLGKSKYIFFVTFFVTLIEWTLALLLVSIIGYIGVAVTSTIISFISFLLYLYIAQKVGIVPNLTKTLFPKIIILIITFIFTVFLNSILNTTIFNLIIKISLTLILYTVLLFVLAKDDLLSIFKLVLSKGNLIFLKYEK